MTSVGAGRASGRRDRWAVRALRALAGVTAAGVVVLAAVVGTVGRLASDRGFPGPGTQSLAAHITAAIVVVGLQVVADRRRGGGSAAASAAVLAVTGVLLWTQWWS